MTITRKLTPNGWEIIDTEDVNNARSAADNSGPGAEPADSSTSDTGSEPKPEPELVQPIDNSDSISTVGPNPGAAAGSSSGNTSKHDGAAKPGKRGKPGSSRNSR